MPHTKKMSVTQSDPIEVKIVPSTINKLAQIERAMLNASTAAKALGFSNIVEQCLNIKDFTSDLLHQKMMEEYI